MISTHSSLGASKVGSVQCSGPGNYVKFIITLLLSQAIRASVADTIPPEPPSDTSELVARLRFRCPNGEMINRRFLGSTPLNILLNYLVTQGYNTQEYKVLTTFPRRDVSIIAPSVISLVRQTVT